MKTENLPIFLTTSTMAERLGVPPREVLNLARRFQIGPDALYETRAGHVAYLWNHSTAKQLAALLDEREKQQCTQPPPQP